MATFIDKKDLKSLYDTSVSERRQWQDDYPTYERLMDNGLMEGLDPNLPEVNDGSLSASLFKLPKRIVSDTLSGTVKATDRDEAWLGELANQQWQNNIVPNANTQAPFIRKWKDAVRKAAGYGSVPIITLFVNRGDYTGADFIVAQPQDVTFESGKVSDYDSDVIWWDVYYSDKQLDDMIATAEEEIKEGEAEKAKWDKDKLAAESKGNTWDVEEPEPYNRWNVEALKKIRKGKQLEQRASQDDYRERDGTTPKKSGYKFTISFQRGINAPFCMFHPLSGDWVREWTNPDPTGDVPVHSLYCYQDFINPYGVGIVKLAGGTQNVLDYMRQADVLATQIGLRPPIQVGGDADSADLESLVYAQDALWFTGSAQVQRMNLDNGIYQQLLNRMSAYKISLNQVLPTGDTSITGDSGDQQYSKTPAGVKFQQANLSIDDEDFKDNFYATYEAVAKSMINTHFANMEGNDLMRVSDDQRQILINAGFQMEKDENGQLPNDIDVTWDDVRAKFDFSVDPEADKTKDDAEKLEGLNSVLTTIANPATAQLLQQGEMILGNKKLNVGELIGEIISLTSDNDKILSDITPEEQDEMNEQEMMAPQQGQLPPEVQAQAEEQPQQEMTQEMPPEAMQEMLPPEQPANPDDELEANVQAVMQEYGVDYITAAAALSAEQQGMPMEDIIKYLSSYSQQGGEL